MNNLDTLIENGLVVTENEIGHLNIGIKDGKIAYLGDENLNAEFKINADKTFVHQSNSLRQGESAPDRLQVIAAILLANSRICFSSDSFKSSNELESTAPISHNLQRTAA